jgi:hypothetical protein
MAIDPQPQMVPYKRGLVLSSAVCGALVEVLHLKTLFITYDIK